MDPRDEAEVASFAAKGSGYLVGTGKTSAEEREARADSTSLLKPTPRQRQIIELLAQGKTNKEIAAGLNLSTRTIEVHRATIMLKFGFHSIADLVIYAIRERMVPVLVDNQQSRAAKSG
jgi:DNA-binding NarL/FixJ family response regulator